MTIVIPVFAQQDESPPCQTLPSNVSGDAALVRQFMSFVAKSETLRQLCATIAAARHARVVLRVASRPPMFALAVSTIQRFEAGFVRVVIDVPVGPDVGGLLAHELAHVVEAIEGVDLAALARVDGSGVIELEKGLYETVEAQRIGRLVSSEIDHTVTARADSAP